MSSRLLFRLLRALAALALSGCTAGGESVKTVATPIPAQQCENGGIFGQLLTLAGYTCSISTVPLGTAESLRDTDELTIQTMAIRTRRAGDDQARAALIDGAL